MTNLNAKAIYAKMTIQQLAEGYAFHSERKDDAVSQRMAKEILEVIRDMKGQRAAKIRKACNVITEAVKGVEGCNGSLWIYEKEEGWDCSEPCAMINKDHDVNYIYDIEQWKMDIISILA